MMEIYTLTKSSSKRKSWGNNKNDRNRWREISTSNIKRHEHEIHRPRRRWEGKTDESDQEEASSGKKRKEKREEYQTNEGNETEKNKEHNEAHTEDFVIEKIVNHQTNKCRLHPYARAREAIYVVRSYGHETDDETPKQTRHLPRGKMLSYFQKKKLPIPDNIY